MNWKDLLNSNVFAAFVASAVVVAGWNVSSSQRVAELRRQFETEYLVDTFRVLYSASTVGRELCPSAGEALTRAVGDLNVFGTADQVALARRFAEAMEQPGSADAAKLLEDFRDEFRRELDFDSLEGDDLLLARFGPPIECENADRAPAEESAPVQGR